MAFILATFQGGNCGLFRNEIVGLYEHLAVVL